MKKIKLTIIILTLFILIGCGKKDEYSNYEHNNFKDKPTDSYTSYNFDDEKYLVYQNLDDKENTYELYYQIADDDYILLEKLNYKYKYNYFYYDEVTKENKLYILNNNGSFYEYHLDKEKITKEELHFKFLFNDTDIIPNLELTPIVDKIENNTITFRATYVIKDKNDKLKDQIASKLTCRFDNYVCEESERTSYK